MINAQPHNLKHWLIDGHAVTASFADAPDPELFDRIRNILLGEQNSHICEDTDACITMEVKHLEN